MTNNAVDPIPTSFEDPAQPKRPKAAKVRSRKQKKYLQKIIIASTILILILTITLLVQTFKSTKCQIEASVCSTKECTLSAATLINTLHREEDPCQDFYSFVCGKEDKATANVFRGLYFQLLKKLKHFLEKSTSTNELRAENNAKKFYQTCMNTSKIKEEGIEPLKTQIQSVSSGWPWLPIKIQDGDPELTDDPETDFGSGDLKVKAIMNKGSPMSVPLELLLGKLDRIGLSSTKLFQAGVINDFNDRRIRRMSVDQYDPMEEINRRQLRVAEEGDLVTAKKIIGLIQLLRKQDLSEIVDEIGRMMKLKAQLEEMTAFSEDRKNFTTRNNKMTVAELTEMTQNKFKWIDYFNVVLEGITQLTENDIIIVQNTQFFEDLPTIFDVYDKSTISNLAMWNALINPLLPHVYAINMTEIAEEVRDYLLCVPSVSELLPFAVGRLFTDAYTHNSTLETSNKFVKQLRESFKDIISKSEWLDKATKRSVNKKLDSMVQQVGFPKWIKDDEELDNYYQNVDIGDNHIPNVLSAQLAIKKRSLLRLVNNLTKPWLDEAGVVTVNAFYDSSRNSIIFPIGILQIPFYEDNRLAAINFGAVGSVIGHEIGHAFDNVGSQFDENGELKTLWSKNSKRIYDSKIQCYVNQYNNYCFQGMPGNSNETCLDGSLTVGENTPDNIGMQAAYNAYKAWIKTHKKEKRLPGLGKLTPEQIFFISFAYIWCDNSNAKKWFSNHKHDSHSPGRYRVQGALSNFEEFSNVFQCKKGPMNRESERCTLW